MRKKIRKNCPKGMTACGHCQACIADKNAHHERDKHAFDPPGTKTTKVSGRSRSKRVRSPARGKSAPSALRRLNTEALVTIGYDRPQAEGLKLPTLAVHFGIVGHGYEIHVFNEGRYIGAGCRDFSGTHKVEDLKISLMETIEDAVKTWRAKL